MNRLYIINNDNCADMIIAAKTEKECFNKFAKQLGFKDYKTMKKYIGKDNIHVNCEYLYNLRQGK